VEIVSDLNAVTRRIREIAELTPSLNPVFEELIHSTLGNRQQASVPAPSPEVERLIIENARACKLDPALVEAIIANESGFKPRARSSAGARGLMQLMPQTAASLGVSDPYDPAQNIWGGTRYLHSLLGQFEGSVERAVAAYNAGPAAVAKYDGIPPYAQTRTYVRNVLASLQRYRAQPPR
jgi:soluble lytic murein transglycosylase-like protein